VEQDGALSRMQGSLVEGTPFLPPGATNNSVSKTNNSGEGVTVPIDDRLNSFWRRYNESLLRKVACQERRDRLLEENRVLQVRRRKEEGRKREGNATVLHKRKIPHYQGNLKPFVICSRNYSSPSNSTWTE
jgi:hypothetical protein